MDDQHECRHRPRPVWNPDRCERCGALVERPALAWTSERPTVPGWYWVNYGHGDCVTEIRQSQIDHMAERGDLVGRFAGPIPCPDPGEARGPAARSAPPARLETEEEWDNRRDRLGRDL